MNYKTEAAVNGVAALVVLFTAMVDPRISVVVAVFLLIALSIWSLLKIRAPDR